jgi:putative peptidoglycan lipid II flippase
MSAATLLSRLLGYGRDMVSAGLFGASAYSDAFVVAFRLPNLFRDLFAEGALSSSFVPALARHRHQHGAASAWTLASLMLSALAMILAVLVLAGIILAPWLLALVAPGFKANPAQFQLALKLTRLLFPFIGFMGMAALFMGMLNERRQFLGPALAPAAMNVVMISFGLLVCPRFGPDPKDQIVGWAWGALAGGAAQWLVQVPGAWKAGFHWRPRWPWADAGVLKVFRQMGPAVIGLSTTQVNLVVNTLLASQLAAGAVTTLYYGNRLMQLPLGIFGVAIATAVLPDLASSQAAGQQQRFKHTLSYGLRMSLFLTLPCLVGLVGLALPINVLLLKVGRFDLDAARATAAVSVAYTLGVVFASWVKVLVPAFYALDEPGLPVKVSFGMMLVNLVFNLLLWRPFGAVGLAATASVTALIQAGSLLWLLRRRLGPLASRQDLAEGLRILGAAAAMGLGLWQARRGLDAWQPGWDLGAQGRPALLLWVLLLIAGGAALYASLALALNLQGLLPQRLRFGRLKAAEAEVAKASADAYD